MVIGSLLIGKKGMYFYFQKSSLLDKISQFKQDLKGLIFDFTILQLQVNQ
jgi:hypothetical protein